MKIRLFPTRHYVGLPVGGLDDDLTFEYHGSTTGTSPRGIPVSFGGRFDYIATETLGIGLDINYATYGYFLTDTSRNDKYDELLVTKYRVMLRFNKYFILRNDITAYFGFGMGYKGGNRLEVKNGKSTRNIFFPLDGRFALGVRYYFNEYVGIHAETGIGGGGVIQAGISCRF